MRYYALDGTTVREITEAVYDQTRIAGPQWIAKDTVGRFYISTIFLSLDHSFSDEDDPILFETMMSENGSWIDDVSKRHSTYAEALAYHRGLVEGVTSKPEPQPPVVKLTGKRKVRIEK